MKDPMKKAAQRSVSKVKLYQSVFSGPEGRKVLLDLMSTHGMMNSTFSGDVNAMLIKEGERNVVLRILTMLKQDINQLQERINSYVSEIDEP